MNIIKKLVIKNLMLNKKRTIVSIIGIILAIALLTALFTITGSFRTSIIEREKEQNGNYHICFQDVEPSDVEKFKQNRYVANVYTECALGFAWLEGSENEYKPYAYVTSYDINSLENIPFCLCDGRMPENNSEILISRHVNTNGRVGLKVGDTITLEIGRRVEKDAEDKSYELNIYTEYLKFGEEEIVDSVERTYTIVGMVQRASFAVEPYSCPGYTFVTVFDGNGSAAAVADPATDSVSEGKDTIDKVYIELTDKGLAQIDDVVTSMLGIHEYKEYFAAFNELDSAGWNGSATEEDWDFYFNTVLPQTKYNWEFNTWLIRYQRVWPIDSMFVTLFAIAGFVGLVIVITSVYCIKNSFEISVSEKIRLYGMLAGIGATRRQIRKSVAFEALITGAVGLPGGIGLGLLASFILSKISNALIAGAFLTEQIVRFEISWVAIAISVVLGILTIYFSSISATVKAGKITPIEAIRNTNEIKLNAKKIKAPGYISKIWGVGGVIAYKNIKRNKRKYRTSVVSIAICTLTFIVVSYFMSMLFSVSRSSYIEEKSNIQVSLYKEGLKSEDIESYFDTFDDIKSISYISYNLLYFENVDMSKELRKSLEREGVEIDDEYGLFVDSTQVWVLDDNSFNEYVRSLNKRINTGEVVFYNYINIQSMGQIRTCDYEDNKISVSNPNYSVDEGDYDMPEKNKKTYALPVGFETEIVPLGLGYQGDWPAIIMSTSTFEMLNLDEVLDINRTVDRVAIEAVSADQLQDNLEDMFEQNADVFGDECYIANRDREAREERSFYTLIAIFAYGFIAVIALIGITNIINTLGTSTELRAKDFATLRSIGMTDGQFRKMVVLESIFTSAKSLIIGVSVGVGITLLAWYYMCTNGSVIVYHAPIAAIVISIAVVLVLVYLIISVSLGRINKRNIIETIKNENI